MTTTTDPRPDKGNGVVPTIDTSRSTSGCDDHVGASVVVVEVVVLATDVVVALFECEPEFEEGGEVVLVGELLVVAAIVEDGIVVGAAGVHVTVKKPSASFAPVTNDGEGCPTIRAGLT